MRKIRMGMVGGGQGAFIGAVHRMAAALDGQIELAAGAFSSDAARSRASGADYFLDPARCYASYEELFPKEAALPPERRIDFVSIVTPNYLHFPVAEAALRHGFHVVCDKPMTLTLAEAERLRKIVKETGLLFCLTHNYTGYPMVKEARARVRAGELGPIRKIVVDYPQGWLAAPLEKSGQKQADWRTDPARAGASCCLGDIGSHAENLALYISGLRLTEVCAELSTFVPGRTLDDDASVLLRFEGGTRGVLQASQISVGEENSLSIRVHGETGSLSWRQEEPNTLVFSRLDHPRTLIRSGVGPLSAAAQKHTRLPAGHPEGFLEAFANLYRNFAAAIRARQAGVAPDPELDFPGVEEGVRGMAFLEAAVASSRNGKRWQPVAEVG